MSSPANSILTQCVAQLKSSVTLTGVGDAPDVPNGHVQAINIPYSRDQRDYFPNMPVPAVLVSITRNVRIPPAAGDNCTYRAFYTVLFQILHTELFTQNSEVIQSIQQWEYNIHNYFHMGNLQQSADTSNWKITLATVAEVNMLDERDFQLHNKTVCIVPIVFKSIEKNSTTGRT